VPEVEADPGVDAALAEVAVHRAAQAVLLVQRLEVADVVTDLLRRYRGVLPPRPVVDPVGGEGGSPEAAFADLPDLLAATTLLGARQDLDALLGVAKAGGQVLLERGRAALRLRGRVGAELHQEPGLVRRAVIDVRQLLQAPEMHVLALLVLDELLVEPLQADRLPLENLHHVLRGLG
jgi:hypothetical protein